MHAVQGINASQVSFSISRLFLVRLDYEPESRGEQERKKTLVSICHYDLQYLYFVVINLHKSRPLNWPCWKITERTIEAVERERKKAHRKPKVVTKSHRHNEPQINWTIKKNHCALATCLYKQQLYTEWDVICKRTIFRSFALQPFVYNCVTSVAVLIVFNLREPNWIEFDDAFFGFNHVFLGTPNTFWKFTMSTIHYEQVKLCTM